MMVLAAALAAVYTTALAAAPETAIAVIVAPGGLAIPYTRLSLRDIFLRRIFIDNNGLPIIPLNLPPHSPLRQAFSLSLLNAGPQSLQSYWNERYFHGVLPPHVLDSAEAVLRFVAKTPGAIGYVPPCLVDAQVKEIAVLPVPPALRGAVANMCPSGPPAAAQ